jgi:hypothetical protein
MMKRKTKCGDGYDGYMCEVCSSNYFKDRDGSCQPCPPNSEVSRLVAAVIPFAITLLVSSILMGILIYTLEKRKRAMVSKL